MLPASHCVQPVQPLLGAHLLGTPLPSEAGMLGRGMQRCAYTWPLPSGGQSAEGQTLTALLTYEKGTTTAGQVGRGWGGVEEMPEPGEALQLRLEVGRSKARVVGS